MHLAVLLRRYFFVAMHSFTWQGVYSYYAQSLSTMFVSLTTHNKRPNSTKRSARPLQNASSLSDVVPYFVMHLREVQCYILMQLRSCRTEPSRTWRQKNRWRRQSIEGKSHKGSRMGSQQFTKGLFI